MFILRAQPHAQSLFLFPIVFGINLSEAGLVCGHWIMPMLWSGGRTDKIFNKLAGDVACLGGSMVVHQPRLLGSRVRFPAGAFAIFFRFCQSFTSNFPFPLSLALSFPSSSFPFLFLSLRPFVCALKFDSFFRWEEGWCSWKFDRLCRCFDPLSRHLTEAKRRTRTVSKSASFWQRKVWSQRPSRGEKLRCNFLARKCAKLFANTIN